MFSRPVVSALYIMAIVLHLYLMLNLASTLSNCRLSHKSKWRIFVGIVNHSDIVSHMGTMVEKIILHPHFRIHKQKHDYDIALLKLQTPLNFSSTVQAVCLPEMQQDFPQGSKCWVSGWGSTVPHQGFGSDILQNVLVPLISSQLCNSSCMYKGLITPQMLCAGYLDGHADSCQVLNRGIKLEGLAQRGPRLGSFGDHRSWGGGRWG
uniref:Peptidase S1 domain-containing protein n=1 Tax=Sarcophilus harrisii TaxID=9305 RepID=A0A7N4V079_SARHA